MNKHEAADNWYETRGENPQVDAMLDRYGVDAHDSVLYHFKGICNGAEFCPVCLDNTTTQKENVMSTTHNCAGCNMPMESEFDQLIHVQETGCPGIPEFPEDTNNQKENTTMSTTVAFTNCIAINKGNHKKCQSHQSKIIVPVMVKAGEAVHEDMYKSGNLVGWFRHELPFCIGHGNQLLKGKKVMVQSLKAQPQQLTIEVPTTKEEDTMSTNYDSMTVEELEELASELFQTGAEIYEQSSVYETKEEWKAELDEVGADLAKVEEAINNKKEKKTMSTTKKILCGKCHEEHDTPAEVAACYGVQRHTNTTTSMYGRKVFANRSDAVKFLRSLVATKKGMDNLDNGTVRVWWNKS